MKRIIGRYALHGVIASGGMASVHLGRLIGMAGFTRMVAIKRLLPNFASDPEFVSMLIDEARLVARINHPNVVAMYDVVALKRELLLVMEYVHGESLIQLMTLTRGRGEPIPRRVLLAILSGVLHGLHAAHEALSERGERLNLVHRDVSPHNILVGADGVARVLDFGIAKASGRLQATGVGQLKGKIRYMAPEQLKARADIDRRADIYAASVVLWEGLTGRRLFDGDSEWQIANKVMEGARQAPSTFAPVPPNLDALVMRGLDRNPQKRFATAYDMAVAIENLGPMAIPREVGEWVSRTATEVLQYRAWQVSEVEGRPVDVNASIPSMPSVVRAPAVSEASNYNPPPNQDVTRREAVSPKDTPANQEGRVDRRKALGLGPAAMALASVLLFVATASSLQPKQLAHSTGPVRAATLGATFNRVDTGPPSAAAEQEPPIQVAPTPQPTPPVASRGPAKARPQPLRCNPPYYFDNDGVKHLKRECM